MFVKQMLVGPMDVFAYLIGDTITGDALVIDPADDTEKIITEAKNNKLHINYIVNTHGHVDHTGGNARMKKLTGAKIIIHEEDAVMLTSTPAMLLRMFRAEQSPPPDILVKDGDTINIGNLSLKVLHTPGHSPGGISLYIPGFVFTGDTLFVENVGRTDLPGASWNAMHKSIMERLLTLPDDTKVMPGHNYGRTPMSTIGHERKYNPAIS